MFLTKTLVLNAAAIVSHSVVCFAQESPRNQAQGMGQPRSTQFTSAIVENSGQWDPHILWSVRGSSTSISGVENSFVLSLTSPAASEVDSVLLETVHLIFEGANTESRTEYVDPKQQNSHYFLGKDDCTWKTNASSYGSVKIVDLYSGVDLLLKFDGHVLEYDFICNDPAALQNVVVKIDGASALDLDSSGALIINLELGSIRQRIPNSYWTKQDEEKQPAHCRFRIIDSTRIGFELISEPLSSFLVIDPTIEFSTFWGVGTPGVKDTDIATDAAGNTIIAGTVSTPTFPTTPGAYDTTYNDVGGGGMADLFVMKMNSTGSSLMYSTFIGGNQREEPTVALSSDSIGNAYVCGGTWSTNFPLTPAAPYSNTGHGAYLCKLNPTGSSLLFSTYISNNSTLPNSMSADESGNAFAAGTILAPGILVTPGAFQPFSNTGMFVTKMDTVNSAIGFGTYISPPNNNESGYAVAADGTGGAWVVGQTGWTGLPVTPNAIDTTNTPGFDSFLVQLNAQGTALNYASYLGFFGSASSANSKIFYRAPYVYLCLRMNTSIPVTLGAFEQVGNFGPVLMKIDPSTGSIVFATFLFYVGGGTAFKLCGLDESENCYITATFPPTWPFVTPTTPDAFKSVVTGPNDGYIFKINNTGTGLLFASYFGGSGDDAFGRCVGVGSDSALVLGLSLSQDFPITPGAYDTTPGFEFTLTRFKLPQDPYGVTRFGTGTPGCNGAHQFTTNEPLSISAKNFQFICDNAPPNSLGVAIVSDQPDQFGYETLGLGVSFHIGFFGSELIGIDMNSDKWGTGKTLPISLAGTSILAGMKFYAQGVWLWPNTGCLPSFSNLSTSNGIEIVVQP